jgi:hypothetical protein
MTLKSFQFHLKMAVLENNQQSQTAGTQAVLRATPQLLETTE